MIPYPFDFPARAEVVLLRMMVLMQKTAAPSTSPKKENPPCK